MSQLTPTGVGGVALIRCSGPGSAAALTRSFSNPRGLPAVGQVRLGELRDLGGQALDQVLLVRTAVDAFELGCHGGPGVVRAVLAELTSRGARPEAPSLGSSEHRVADEARRALPHATTELGCQVLLSQLGGALDLELESLVAALDSDPHAARRRLRALLGKARLGRALLDPPRVALVGLPNAGKSSLLNALLGRERAIVASEAGTTRDTVEELAELEGVPAHLVDTAGQRETRDEVEAAGVERATRASDSADCRLLVLDVTDLTSEALALAEAVPAPRVVVLNKIDLAAGADEGPQAGAALRGALRVSAASGAGLPALRAALRAALIGEVDAHGAVPFTPRQLGLLEGAARALERGDVERATGCLSAIRGR